VPDPYEEEGNDRLYWGTVLMGNAGGNEAKHLSGGIRIMEGNKLRIALYLGGDMFARRTLLQLATKLALGLGALFVVGVLLAAIPNHHAPAVTGSSPEQAPRAQGADRSDAQGMKMDEAKSREREDARATRHNPATAPKAGDSTR